MSSAVSLIKTLDGIVVKKLAIKEPKTTNLVPLYIAGSTLTPTALGKLSY